MIEIHIPVLILAAYIFVKIHWNEYLKRINLLYANYVQVLKIDKGITICNVKMPDFYIGSLSSTKSAVGKA